MEGSPKNGGKPSILHEISKCPYEASMKMLGVFDHQKTGESEASTRELTPEPCFATVAAF